MLGVDALDLRLGRQFLLLPGRVRDEAMISAGRHGQRGEAERQHRSGLTQCTIVGIHDCLPHSITNPAWPETPDAPAVLEDVPASRCEPSAPMDGSVGTAGAAGLEIGCTT